MNLGRTNWLFLGAIVVMVAASTLPAGAQFNSGAQPIALTATLAESLTVSLSASAVNFTLTSGSATNAGSTNITATTSWVLKPSETAVGIYAYFASSAAALTDGSGDNIPSADFQISDNGGALQALTNTVPFGGANAGLQLANITITKANDVGSHTDVMAYNINLSSLVIPAGTYTGTLDIQAQATP